MNRITLPELSRLLAEIEADPERIRRRLAKAEFWIGSNESVEHAKKFMSDAHPEIRAVVK